MSAGEPTRPPPPGRRERPADWRPTRRPAAGWRASRPRVPGVPGCVECGCPPEVRGACGCAPRHLPRAPIAVGAVLGTLTVTDGAVYRPSPDPGRRFERWVKARCTCGAATAMRAPAWFAAERRGQAVTCGGAAHAAERAARQRRGAAHPAARYAGPVPSSVWAAVRANARHQVEKHARRGERFAFTLTHADLAALWAQQAGHCTYTGLALSLSPKARETSASLDRIDSRRGYVLGNVHFVHKAVNIMKRDFTERAYLRLARAVARLAVARQAVRLARSEVRAGHPQEGWVQGEFPGWRGPMPTAGSPDKASPARGGTTVPIPPWCLGAGGQDGVPATGDDVATSAAPALERVSSAPTECAASGRRYRRAVYRCRACPHGRTFVARVDNVRYGNTRSCGCLPARARAAVRRPVAGVIGRTYWAEVQRNARVRGLAFDLTPEAAWDQYLAQAGHCALTGWRIGFAGERAGRRRQTASLDRVDAARGYAPDNVVWTHKAVNLSRRELSVAAFVGWCVAVAAHCGRRWRVRTAVADLPLFAQPAARSLNTGEG